MSRPSIAVSRFSLSLCVVLLLWACDADEEAVATYHTRGLVEQTTGTGAALRVTIHHEAVAKFKDRDGHASKMESMKMVFGLGPKLTAADVQAGDKLDFDFEVRWSRSPTLVITKLERLPPGTPLAFEAQP